MYKKLLLLVLMLPVSLFAQNKLEGTVTDKATGQNMPGVNVVVKGTENGTSTDFTGAFKLLNLNSGDVITFSFLGYKSFTLNYTGQATVSVALHAVSDI